MSVKILHKTQPTMRMQSDSSVSKLLLEKQMPYLPTIGGRQDILFPHLLFPYLLALFPFNIIMF